MFNKVKIQRSRLLVLALLACQTPAAIAAPYPGSGAPLAAAKQMASDGGDPANPFSYPLLKDIAKSLTRNGFPASFFLSLDSKPGPGIDLRTILLYEAGVLKSPVKLNVPQHRKKSDLPTLSITSIPESSGQMPSAAPKLNEPGGIDSGRDENPEANGKAAARKRKKDNSELSVDLNRFQLNLAGSPVKNERGPKEPADLTTLAMAQPLSVEPPSISPEDSAFRFWTVPAVAVPSPPVIENKAAYTGAYVMMSPTGLKAIDGRTFVLTGGQTLVSSNAKNIVVDTPVAKVIAETGATVYVEIVKPGVARIRVLESKSGDQGVAIKYTADGKANEMQLGAGDDLLIADHTLSDLDKAMQEKSGTAGGGEMWSKSKFSPKSVLDSDKFLSTDTPGQNPEQRAALVALRKRIK